MPTELRDAHSLGVTLIPEPNGEYERRARILGEVWAIRALCGHPSGTSDDLRMMFDPAIRHHRIRVFYNSLSDPVGYVAWAHLAPDVEARWMRDGYVKLHLSEWTEGQRLWIVDGMVALGYGPAVAALALKDIFTNCSTVRLARRKSQGIVFKELDRTVWERFKENSSPASVRA